MLDEKSSNTASVVVLCTAPDEATAQDLAAKVLAEKLAACATLIPGATSLYYWEGKLEQEYEVQMILKTTVSHQQALLECLKSHHPYQTPEQQYRRRRVRFLLCPSPLRFHECAPVRRTSRAAR